jgi:hypothetical protein
MSSVIDRKAKLAWFEQVCQKLDLLKEESAKYADEDDVLPSCGLFDTVKQRIQDLLKLTDFKLATPDVWRGPDGQIGLTWSNQGRSLELIFCEDGRELARLTEAGHQKFVEKNVLAVELKHFAAKKAS